MTTQATTERTIVEVGRAMILDYNRKDWDAAKNAMAPGYVYDEIATNRRVQGANAALEAWRGWATAFPDSEGQIHNTLVSGDTAITELTWKGTHTGPLQTGDKTIAPTGRRIEMRACQITTVKDGKAETTRHYFDLATMLRQLGLAS